MKNTLLFICSTNILVRLLSVNIKNSLTPKNPKLCDPILVTLLKMRPHYSQSSRENATPSSGTSPLATYKEGPPPPPRNTAVSPPISPLSRDSPAKFPQQRRAARSEDGSRLPLIHEISFIQEKERKKKTYRVLLRQTKFPPYKLLIW